jgi:ABC-2 type transport system ATP-binding protein
VSHALSASDLRVSFGPTPAVDGVSLSVDYGEVVTLLGPNGAGKTTVVETLLGFRRPTSGQARVHGLDPVRDHREVVTRTGALLQRGGVWFPMTPRQVLTLTATYYPEPRRVDELLSLLDLATCAATPWRRLSGGEQQRTLLALALIGRPKVLILDEPTTAVDPEGRHVIRQLIASERARGCALLITTHELSEAERLADRVIIMNHGRVVSEGTLDELAGPPVVIVETSVPVAPALLATALGVRVERHGELALTCHCENSPVMQATLATALATVGATLTSLRSRASLEERYFALLAEESS